MCSQLALNQITQKVVRAAIDSLGDKLDKVILYGSYARGDFDAESDIDILVLADIPRDDTLRASFAISDAAGNLDLEYDILVSIHVTDSATFYKYIDDLPFYANVAREGVVLSA